MRRSPITFGSNYGNDNRLVVSRDKPAMNPSVVDNLISVQAILKDNVTQNGKTIHSIREENIILAEKIRNATVLYQQLLNRVSNAEDSIETEKSSIASLLKQNKHMEMTVYNQNQQLVSRGVQIERSISRLEGEIVRLKQNNEQTSKRIQTVTAKISQILETISMQDISVNNKVDELRQSIHQHETENTKKVKPSFLGQQFYPLLAYTI